MVQQASANTDASLANELTVDEQEIARRMEFLELTAEDELRLRSINELAGKNAVKVIEAFYEHLLSFDEARPFFRDDPRLIQYVKDRQREYFLRLTQGNYDVGYVESRVRIGEVHVRIGLPIKFYLGMFNWYLRTTAKLIFTELDPERAIEAFISLSKLVFFDMGLAIDTYIEKRERVIREQQQDQAYLAAIVESSADAIIGQSLDGITASWNPGAERLYGYSSEEMKGKSSAVLIPPERPRELKSILDRVARGERIDRLDTEHVRKDGVHINVSLTVSPLRNSKGEIVGAAFISRDTTAQKRAIDMAMRDLSTPVLSVRPDLLTLPIIGPVDSSRALQLTEQLLRRIRDLRARIAVIDITGVPLVDSRVASHLIQTVEAARLMGCTVILTGISPEIARSLVAIGVDLSRVTTRVDLQSGIEEAEHMLGYRLTRVTDGALPVDERAA